MSYNPNGAASGNWAGDLDVPETALGGAYTALLRAEPDMTRLG